MLSRASISAGRLGRGHSGGARPGAREPALGRRRDTDLYGADVIPVAIPEPHLAVTLPVQRSRSCPRRIFRCWRVFSRRWTWTWTRGSAWHYASRPRLRENRSWRGRGGERGDISGGQRRGNCAINSNAIRHFIQ